MATASMSIMALRHCSPTPTFPSCLSTIPATSLSSWKPFPLVRPLLEIKSPKYLCCSAQLKDTDNEIRSQQDQNQEEEEELDKINNAPINEEVNKKKQRLQTGGVGRGSAESTDWIASSLTRRFGLAGGLAWFGFLAFGVISEQVKTRLELSQEQQNIRFVYLHDSWAKSATWVMTLDVQGWMITYQLRDLSFPGVWSTLIKQGHFSRKYHVLA